MKSNFSSTIFILLTLFFFHFSIFPVADKQTKDDEFTDGLDDYPKPDIDYKKDIEADKGYDVTGYSQYNQQQYPKSDSEIKIGESDMLSMEGKLVKEEVKNDGVEDSTPMEDTEPKLPSDDSVGKLQRFDNKQVEQPTPEEIQQPEQEFEKDELTAEENLPRTIDDANSEPETPRLIIDEIPESTKRSEDERSEAAEENSQQADQIEDHTENDATPRDLPAEYEPETPFKVADEIPDLTQRNNDEQGEAAVEEENKEVNSPEQLDEDYKLQDTPAERQEENLLQYEIPKEGDENAEIPKENGQDSFNDKADYNDDTAASDEDLAADSTTNEGETEDVGYPLVDPARYKYGYGKIKKAKKGNEDQVRLYKYYEDI